MSFSGRHRSVPGLPHFRFLVKREFSSLIRREDVFAPSMKAPCTGGNRISAAGKCQFCRQCGKAGCKAAL